MSYTLPTKEERYQIRAMLDADCTIRDVASFLARSPGHDLALAVPQSWPERLSARPGVSFRQRARGSQPMLIPNHHAPRDRKQPADSPRLEPRAGQRSSSRGGHVRHLAGIDLAVHLRRQGGGGDLWRRLRCRRKRRKRYGSRRNRPGRIPDQVGIEARPTAVETRETTGYLEGDTIVGKRHRGAAMTAVERKSRLPRIGKLPSKSVCAMRPLSPLAAATATSRSAARSNASTV